MIPKFRAWDKKYKKMMKVNQIDFEKKTVWLEADNGDHENRHTLTREFKDVILMQSTGLKDKNGVEIFESDLVKVIDGESEEDSYISVVKNYSNEGYPAFDIEYPPNYHYDRNVLSAIMCNGFETIEVTGNVYDNPELLEVAE